MSSRVVSDLVEGKDISFEEFVLRSAGLATEALTGNHSDVDFYRREILSEQLSLVWEKRKRDSTVLSEL